MYVLIYRLESTNFSGRVPIAPRKPFAWLFGMYGSVQNEDEDEEEQAEIDENPTNNTPAESAPNIQLNLHGGSKTRDLFTVACIGVCLQLGILVFAGLSVYAPGFRNHFLKTGGPVKGYAYPLVAVGTTILVCGMMICSAVIEKSTVEESYVRVKKGADKVRRDFRILWLQKSHVVSDQVFDSYAIFKRGTTDRILTSRRRAGRKLPCMPAKSNSTTGSSGGLRALKWVVDLRWIPAGVKNIAADGTEALALLGSSIGLVGFVLQFEGFRGMNWSASIAQLVGVLVMTLLRAWVRRGLIITPAAVRVPGLHEMDWLALWFCEDENKWPEMNADQGSASTDAADVANSLQWEICTGKGNIALSGCFQNSEQAEHRPKNHAQKALMIRQRLGQLTNWSGKISTTAVAVANTIEAIANTFFQTHEQQKENFVWFLNTSIGYRCRGTRKIRQIKLHVRCVDGGVWRADATEIEALLSLWVFCIENPNARYKRARKEAGKDWLRRDMDFLVAAVRSLGMENNELKGDQEGHAEEADKLMSDLERDLRPWTSEWVPETCEPAQELLHFGLLGLENVGKGMC